MSTKLHTHTPQDLLPRETSMGPVTLAVGDLDRMVSFYRDGLGLKLLAEEKGTATLGRQGRPVLVLDQDGTLAHAPAGAAGLYHTAFLFPEAAELASVVASVARQYPGQFQGSSDHLVSEAFYFGDPEGNGVELYIDRPRDTWQINPNGEVQMATLALDPNAFLRTHLTEQGAESIADTPAEIGHVHLKVGNIAAAREFYVETVGFEVTFEFGSQALFVSAGGYHHHLGMNTWESRGAGERTPALGLGEVTITLPDTSGATAADALGALSDRLAAQGIAREGEGKELVFLDPWRNRVRVLSA
ncbi:VOC family protein [Leucobacter sp. W1478]|uniref:VOC family protein n=1 Tax=Leucobacter sp. W1478 TaxID=3439065 RepID=UPI003F2AD380